MKKRLQNKISPFAIFGIVILLLGCNQPAQQTQDSSSNLELNQHTLQSKNSNIGRDNIDTNDSTEFISTQNSENLKQGNVFYIARDVANVQLNTGDYVENLQQIQLDLKQAIENKDQTKLQSSVKSLARQLQSFNTALISLDLRSQEIDGIRQQVLQANKQVLDSSLLNGHVDLSQIDFQKIEKQINTIQTDMIKLVGMVLLPL